jgi:hypothetical protein
MGIKIAAVDESTPPPRQSYVVIECDVASEMFCRGFLRSDDGEAYSMFMSRAVRKGWTERRTNGNRVFVCPECK